MSNQNDQQSLSGDFVEKRRAALERYMIRTAAHPVLCVDPDFREFLECGMSKAIYIGDLFQTSRTLQIRDNISLIGFVFFYCIQRMNCPVQTAHLLLVVQVYCGFSTKLVKLSTKSPLKWMKPIL